MKTLYEDCLDEHVKSSLADGAEAVQFSEVDAIVLAKSKKIFRKGNERLYREEEPKPRSKKSATKTATGK